MNAPAAKWLSMAKLKMITCCLCFLFTLPVFAQEEGIRFFKGSWKKLLAEAKQSGKLIFVDVYTDWCVPCKKMVQEIFPLKTVGDKYNAHFINYQIDAEKGEGIFVKKEYQVKSYPAYLYINGDGDLVFKGGSYSPNPKRFLALADTALRFHETNKSIAASRAVYESGKQDKAVVKEYLKQLKQLDMSEDTIGKVLDQYFSLLTPEDLKDTATAAFLLKSLSTVRPSPVLEYITSHQSFYNTFFPKFPAELSNVVIYSLIRAIDKNDASLFQAAVETDKKLTGTPLRYPYSFFLFANQYYAKTGQAKKLIERSRVFMDSVYLVKGEEMFSRDRQLFEEFMQPYISGKRDSSAPDFPVEKARQRTAYTRYVATALIATAEMFLRHAKRKTDLQKACRWAEKAVELDKRNYAYYPALAKLYAKTGRQQEAITTMQSAITMGQEQRAPEAWVTAQKKALQEL